MNGAFLELIRESRRVHRPGLLKGMRDIVSTCRKMAAQADQCHIKYESSDGRIECRAVELDTEHYSRGQLAVKVRAGFVRYRAGSNGRSRGGTRFDRRHLERMG